MTVISIITHHIHHQLRNIKGGGIIMSRPERENLTKMNIGDLKLKGIKRKVDSIGRIVVPKEFRDELGIENGEPLEIFLTNKGILLCKPIEKQ